MGLLWYWNRRCIPCCFLLKQQGMPNPHHAASIESLCTVHRRPLPLGSPVSGLAPNPTMTYVSCRSHDRASIGGRLRFETQVEECPQRTGRGVPSKDSIVQPSLQQVLIIGASPLFSQRPPPCLHDCIPPTLSPLPA